MIDGFWIRSALKVELPSTWSDQFEVGRLMD